MPISDEALQSPKNRYVAVKRDATVGQAIGALKALGGHGWWQLVVQRDDGSWGVTTFTALHKVLERTADAADVRLGNWKGLKAAIAVDQDQSEPRVADALVRKEGVLVVTRDGVPTGILVKDVNRGGPVVPGPKLSELGGKYINLKDYGSILLSSSKK